MDSYLDGINSENDVEILYIGNTPIIGKEPIIAV